MNIRAMNDSDIAAGLHLCRLSGWNQLEEDWRCFLQPPDGSAWIAERDGVARGTVASLRYGTHFSWLSMMLVHPGARRTGLGTQLMETVCAALEGDACIRLDATPLGEPLYRRFGFEGEGELIRAKVRVAPEMFSLVPDGVHQMRPDDLAEIFDLDYEVFGADRSALLASFRQRGPEMARVARTGGELCGYCFGRPGHLYRQLGPVVARDEGTARDLVARCLQSFPGEMVAIDVPRAATEWSAWLEAVGFTLERPFLRMHRGRNRWPGLPSFQFAMAGPEFG